MASREQQGKPGVLTATYKCRRCSKVDAGPSGGYGVVFQDLVSLTVHPSGPEIGMLSVRHCEDGGLGMSDLLGADPND